MIRFIVAAMLLLAFTASSEARQRTSIAHPDCNVLWPCIGVSPSPRGEMIARQVGFGAAQKIYTPRAERQARKPVRMQSVTPKSPKSGSKYVPNYAAKPIKTTGLEPQIVVHPEGCPQRLFCGCGAAKRLKDTWGIVVEKPRELWLAASWYRFPKAQPAPGMVAVRRHHVYVIEAYLGDGKVLAYDANSGGGKTRIHVRSLAGYAVVNPRGGSA
jgi:hypothetical protein